MPFCFDNKSPGLRLTFIRTAGFVASARERGRCWRKPASGARPPTAAAAQPATPEPHSPYRRPQNRQDVGIPTGSARGCRISASTIRQDAGLSRAHLVDSLVDSARRVNHQTWPADREPPRALRRDVRRASNGAGHRAAAPQSFRGGARPVSESRPLSHPTRSGLMRAISSMVACPACQRSTACWAFSQNSGELPNSRERRRAISGLTARRPRRSSVTSSRSPRCRLPTASG